MLVDVMVSLEYYLEVLCECCFGCDEILDIICSSLEILCYWLLLDVGSVLVDISVEVLLVVVECIDVVGWDVLLIELIVIELILFIV